MARASLFAFVAVAACASPPRAPVSAPVRAVAPPARALVAAAPPEVDEPVAQVATDPTETAPTALWSAFVPLDAPSFDADLAVGARYAATAAVLSSHGEGHTIAITLLDLQLRALHRRVLGRDDAVRSVAIAPSPEGWVLALGLQRGSESIVETLWLSEDLSQGGATASQSPGNHPILTERPNGGPLLQWSHLANARGSHRAALLDARGGPLWSTEVFPAAIEPQFGSAAWTGDGFLVAQRTGGVQVRALDLDGRAGPAISYDGTSTEYPQVSASSGGVTLSWANFEQPPCVRATRLRNDGTPLEPAVTLGTVPAWFNPAPTLDHGAVSLVLLGGYTGGTGMAAGLGLVRWARGGLPRAPQTVLPRSWVVRDYHLTRLAGEPLVWWIDTRTDGLWVVRPLRSDAL